MSKARRAVRTDGEATRNRILEAAGELFAAGGYAETTSKAIAARAEGGMCRASCPRIVADPRVGSSSPSSIRNVVVFPEPFRPRNAVTLPRGTAKVTSSTTHVDPK